MLSNPALAALLDETLGQGWVTDLARLEAPRRTPATPRFANAGAASSGSTRSGAQKIQERTSIVVDPDVLFDIQVKRIHEYKRQHLNALHVIALYRRLRENPTQARATVLRVRRQSGAGVSLAKLVIRLVTGVAEIVNADPVVAGRIKVVFYPDFNVKHAHFIYPAADLSEQISTAGMEASGTGNMKFMLNGAVTIGTLDGANVEIRDAVGPDNFFRSGSRPQKWRAEAHATVRPTTSSTTTSCAPCSTSSAAVNSRAAIARPSGRCSTVCSTQIRFSCSPILRLTLRARSRSTRPGSIPTAGRGCR